MFVDAETCGRKLIEREQKKVKAEEVKATAKYIFLSEKYLTEEQKELVKWHDAEFGDKLRIQAAKDLAGPLIGTVVQTLTGTDMNVDALDLASSVAGKSRNMLNNASATTKAQPKFSDNINNSSNSNINNISGSANALVSVPSSSQLLLPKPTEVKLLPAPMTTQKQPTQSVLFKSSNNPGDLAEPRAGQVGTHGYLTSKKFTGDELDSHHGPLNMYMKNLGITKKDGIAMLIDPMMHKEIHKKVKKQDFSMHPRSALAEIISVDREIHIKHGMYTEDIKRGLLNKIKKNEEIYPHLFSKEAQPYTIKETTSINIQNQNKQKKSIITNDSTVNSSINNDLSSSSSTSKSNKQNDGIEMINMYQKSYSIKYGSDVVSTDNTKIYNDANNQLINTSNNDNSSHLNVIKTVQFLMFFIDYVTPQWIKTLILSLHPIKNMEKHFEYSNYNPKLVMKFEKVKNVDCEKIEINSQDKEEAMNEFDENSERSTISQGAVINYEEFIGKNKPNEDIVLEEASSNYFQQSWNNNVTFNEETNLFGCNNIMVDVY